MNRAAAAWNGSIFVGTIDGRLLALDASSALAWETDTLVTRDLVYTITGALTMWNAAQHGRKGARHRRPCFGRGVMASGAGDERRTTIDDAARIGILAGRAVNGAAEGGPIVCSCFAELAGRNV